MYHYVTRHLCARSLHGRLWNFISTFLPNLSIYLIYLYIYLSIYLCLYPFLYISIYLYLSISISTIYLYLYLSIYIYLSIYLPIYLSICLSISIYLSIYTCLHIYIYICAPVLSGNMQIYSMHVDCFGNTHGAKDWISCYISPTWMPHMDRSFWQVRMAISKKPKNVWKVRRTMQKRRGRGAGLVISGWLVSDDRTEGSGIWNNLSRTHTTPLYSLL